MKLSKFIPLIGIAIFIYILTKIGIRKISSSILNFNGIIIYAILLIPILMLFQLYKWNLFLKKQNVHLSFWLIFRIMSIGNFYGFITPAQLGSFVRANYIKKYSDCAAAEVYPSVVIERLLDLLAVFIIALVGISFFIKTLSDKLYIIAILFILAAVFTSFLIKRKGISLLLRFMNIFLPKALSSSIKDFVDLFYKKMFRIKDLIYPMAITLLYWLAIFSSSYIIAKSYSLNAPMLDFISIFAVSTLIGLIPVTASGIGTREASLLFLLLPYGSSPELIISMAVSALLLYTAVPAIIGFIFSLCENPTNKLK